VFPDLDSAELAQQTGVNLLLDGEQQIKPAVRAITTLNYHQPVHRARENLPSGKEGRIFPDLLQLFQGPSL
jgi:hypothetical protein